MTNHVEVTDATFQSDVVGAQGVTVLDLWAEWCGPCKRLAPILDEIADEHAGKVRIAKLDVDNNPDTPSQYGVMGIPTLLVFKDGMLVDTIVGFMPKERLMNKILPHLS